MKRIPTFCALASLLAAAAVADTHREPARPRAAQRQRQLLGDVRDMNARLDRGRPSGRDVVADSERLRAGFTSVSLDPEYGRQPDALGEQLAQQSFGWLDRAGRLFRWDPAVAPSLMRTYGAVCDVYRRHSAASRPWLWVGYGGASRVARSLVLSSDGQAYEQALEAYALEAAALNYVAGAVSYLPSVWDTGMPPSEAVQPRTTIEPVPLPAVDEAVLTAEQRGLWIDVRTRFLTVSSRVHEARLLLEDLSARLRARNLSVNDADAATAIKMQGFLEDAAELVQDHQFDKAREALRRADYERAKLKNITGQ